jgi:hypothetical protein
MNNFRPWELRALSPNIYSYMTVSKLYISRISYDIPPHTSPKSVTRFLDAKALPHVHRPEK